ncbi:MAG: hypothetical protein K0U29_03460 [Gammaproteobacteria bacterium]|nr:hypothetical protein [Gammaproteobacteria bacterium]MCH9743970.1 hypothetical protein [Gammaproteobacteria bacterium]
MPFKHNKFYRRRSKIRREQPKRDWSDYNKKMKMRGDITIWLSLISYYLICVAQYATISHD